MIEVAVDSPAVWTPGAEPDVGFLPPLLRRRCTRLTRIMLDVAFRAAARDALASLPAVFASRHGDVRATLALLDTLARRQPLTAAGFSHSVHNAQVGLFSIATGNRRTATAVAGGVDTFGAAFLEAVATRSRSGGGAVLLVVADEELPSIFRSDGEPATPAYAAAMVLGGSGTRLRFEAGAGEPGAPHPVPDALRFVEWLGAGGARLTLGARTPFTWTRLAP